MWSQFTRWLVAECFRSVAVCHQSVHTETRTTPVQGTCLKIEHVTRSSGTFIITYYLHNRKELNACARGPYRPFVSTSRTSKTTEEMSIKFCTMRSVLKLETWMSPESTSVKYNLYIYSSNPTTSSMIVAETWVVAPGSLVEAYRRFGGACYLHHKGKLLPDHRPLQPRSWPSSHSPPWELQISRSTSSFSETVEFPKFSYRQSNLWCLTKHRTIHTYGGLDI
jgi:hypothetical protein